MTIHKEYENPAPPPKLLQVSVSFDRPTRPGEAPGAGSRTGLVQQAARSEVYLSVNAGYWPEAEARAVAEAILEILGQDDIGKGVHP